MIARTLRPLLIAAVVATGLLAAPAAAPPALAVEGLDVTGATTYTVDPDERVVHVRADLTIENTKPSTTSGGVITNYFFTGYALAVHTEASNVRASLRGDDLAVETEAQEEYLEVTIEFGTRLDFGETFPVRLEYDLPDAGERESGGIRVGAAFAAFFVYAFGEDGADVAVAMPRGYRVTTEGDDLDAESTADGTVLRATGIEDPFDWYAWVAGTRRGALTDLPIEVELGGTPHEIVVHAWPEDEQWANGVADRLERGLPVLHELIGLPWPVSGTLEVTEADTRVLGGYAGFYEVGDEIQISSDLDDHVILHEAAHAWFNDRQLWTERWLNEGFADEYAARTVAQLGLERLPADPVSRDQDGAFPLNSWTSVELITDEDARARVEYAYAASWFVVRELVDEIGPSAMRDVIVAAKARELPYAAEGVVERLPPGRIDWRNVLDYLEERGGSEQAAALFRDWVVDEELAATLADRAAARSAYEDLKVSSGGWTPPFAVRGPMSSWRFGDAEEQIAAAQRVIALRERVEEEAGRLGVATTGRLETVFEGAQNNLSSARSVAEEQLTTLEAIATAQATLARDRDFFTTVGLLGEEPDEPAVAAVAAFETDDLGSARNSAAATVAGIEAADDTGRVRVAVAGGAGTTVLLLGGAGLIALARRGRGRRSRATESAAPARMTTSAVAPPEPRRDAERADAPATLPPDSAADDRGAQRHRAEGGEGP